MPNPPPPSKSELRQEYKRIRNNVNLDARRQANLAICRHIEAWQIYQETHTVLTYLAMGSEADLSELFGHQPQKRWAIPRVRPGGQMVFHTYNPAHLVRHAYGMLEPGPDCPVIPSQEIQLVLVPGLAFDGSGWRLGYGGGFYDRFLSNFQGVTAGITYQALILDYIPHAGHDIPMQYLVTETGIKPSEIDLVR